MDVGHPLGSTGTVHRGSVLCMRLAKVQLLFAFCRCPRWFISFVLVLVFPCEVPGQTGVIRGDVFCKLTLVEKASKG